MEERVIFVYFLWVVHSTMDTFCYGLLYGPLPQYFSWSVVNILVLWTVLWQTLSLLLMRKWQEVVGWLLKYSSSRLFADQMDR